MADFKVNNLIVKDKLPVIALKNVVLFPRLVIPLAIGRQKTMAALNYAVQQDKLALFVAQKDKSEKFTPESLYKVGVVGRINSIFKSTTGTANIEVEALARVRILEFTKTDPYFEARVEPIKVEFKKDLETEALIRTAIDHFKKVVDLGRPTPADFLNVIRDLNDPGQILYLIAFDLNLSVKDQQKILESNDLKEAFKMLNTFLVREVEILEAEKKVMRETKKQLGKMQKEMFLREQMKSIEKELGITSEKAEIEELRKKIKEAKMPKEVQAKAMKELERLERIPSFSPEVSYIRTYLDWLIELPWSKKTKGEINIKKAAKILDQDHYGLEKVKERILEYLAVQKQVGKIKGPIICFVGPPGTGKTSIGKSIARALGRKFLRISLGGIRDEAEIRGHRRTYVGALPGRIIQGIHNVKVKNPVFMLDEIDKLGYDFRGDPSAALLEALDPEQNHSFSDHYLEVPFDLSDVMFITTANVLDTIPPALRDRLEIIEFPGYVEHEKFHIAKSYLIPKLAKEHGLDPKYVEFNEQAIFTIIRNYTKEAGVRDLERQLAKIFRKVVRDKVENNKRSKKILINKDLVRKFLGPEKYSVQLAEKKDEVGVAMGLAWTSVGGEVMSIEVTRVPGKGKLELTGHLGKVMTESAKAALSYVRLYLSKVKKAEKDDFYRYDIHIHVPSGAIPKDGPSAGITIATALASLFTGLKVRKDVAMTGEITLRGKVLEVGGIKEKVLAAHRAGIKNVILPKENEKDLDDIPQQVKKQMKFIFVEHMDEVLNFALKFPKEMKDQKINLRRFIINKPFLYKE